MQISSHQTALFHNHLNSSNLYVQASLSVLLKECIFGFLINVLVAGEPQMQFL